MEHDADPKPELIEQKMAETREALSEKVAALETQVVGTIQSATDTVQDTIQSVKATMEDTVSSVKDTVSDVKSTVTDSVQSVSEGVKETFNLSRHTRENPAAMVGGAAAAGFLLGYLVGGRSGHSLLAHGPDGSHPSMPAAAHPGYDSTSAYQGGSGRASFAAAPAAAGPGFFTRMFGPLLDRAGEELKRAGEQAITVAAASLQQTLSEGLPKLLETKFAQATGVHPGDNGGGVAGATRPAAGRPSAF